MVGSAEQQPSIDLIGRLPGKRIVRIDRVWYEADEKTDQGDGPMEIESDDGTVLLLNGGSDGESLRVGEGRWEDPFAPPLADENRRFIEESGKWKRVPVSQVAPYRDLVGATVVAVELLENEFGRVAGLTVETQARTLWFVVQGDEAHVFCALPLGFKVKERFSA